MFRSAQNNKLCNITIDKIVMVVNIVKMVALGSCSGQVGWPCTRTVHGWPVVFRFPKILSR